jgi:hypothetical protein
MRGWKDWMFLAWCVVLGSAAWLAIFPGWPTVALWLSKDPAPAWVQAVGSVAAIIAAAWIASYQERRRAHGVKQGAVKRARNFAGVVQGVVEDVIERASHSAVHMRMRRLVLEEAVIDARSSGTEVLQLDWIIAMQALRAIALNVCELMRIFESGPDYQNNAGEKYPAALASLKTEFERLSVEIDGHVGVIDEKHPGVVAYED